MKKLLMVGLAAATLLDATQVFAGECCGYPTSTYVTEQSQSRYIACYKRVYVPAKIAVNTRGILVRAPSKAWEVGGDTWAYVRNPPVYIETTRVIDPDHYTLVSDACPVAGYGSAPAPY